MSLRFSLLFIAFFPLITDAQNGIPNAGFESWNNGNPDGWSTSNSGSYISVSCVNDAHEGNYAVRGAVIQGVNSVAQPPVLQSISGNYGFPVDASFTAFSFWYKSFLYGGDRFNINVYLYNAAFAVVGGGSLSVSASESSYALATVPITQFTPGTAFAMISFTIADGSGLTNGHIQSWFQVDELTTPGISTQLTPMTTAVYSALNLTSEGIRLSVLRNGKWRLTGTNATGQCLFSVEEKMVSGDEWQMDFPTDQIPGSLILVSLSFDGVLVDTRRFVLPATGISR